MASRKQTTGRSIEVGTVGSGKSIRVLSGRTIKALERAPDQRKVKGQRDALILSLLAHGLRPTEVARLSVGHVERDDGRTRLRFVGAKNGKVRTVTLKPSTARLLDKWTDRIQPRLFIFARRDTHISTRTLERICERWGREVGIGRLFPYMLRHSVGTILARKSNDIWAVSRTLGNSVKVCSDYYSAWLTQDADRMADVLADAERVRRRKPKPE